MSTPLNKLPQVALEVLAKHKRKLGKDFSVIETALRERDEFDSRCRTAEAQVKALEAQRRSLHDEYVMHALTGLTTGRDARALSRTTTVKIAREIADAAMAARV